MKSKPMFPVLALSFAILHAPAHSAVVQPPEGVRWTTASFVQAALEASPELAQSKARMEAAGSRHLSRLADAALPSLSLSAALYPYGDNPLDSYGFHGWGAARDQISRRAGLDWNLFNSFSDYLSVREAGFSKGIAGKEWDAARRGLALSALKAYYGLDLSRNLLEVARGNLGAQQDQYALTQDLYAHGMKSYSDLLKSETDLLSSRLRLAQAEANAKSSLASFNLLLCAPPDAEAPLDSALSAPASNYADLSSEIRSALRERPEAAKARLSVEKAAFQAKGSWQASLPALSLDFSWSNDQAAGFGGTYSNTPPNPRYWLGLSLALPSGFNGLSQAGRVSEARANLRSARAALREAEKSVTGEVASARIELERALSALGTARRKAEIAAESLSLVTQHYRQGSADVIRLGQAQLDNLDALTQRAQALHDAVLSRARYAYATGGPL